MSSKNLESKQDFFNTVVVKEYESTSLVCEELDYGLFIYKGDLYFKYDSEIFKYDYVLNQMGEVKDLDYDYLINKNIKLFTANNIPIVVHRFILKKLKEEICSEIYKVYNKEEDWNHPIMNAIYKVEDLLEQDPN